MVDRETQGVVVSVVVILLVFAFLFPLIPHPAEKFSELGVLGSDKKISDYPANVTAGQASLLYVYIGNHEGAAMLYQVQVLLGNSSTFVNASVPAKAQQIAQFYRVLANNQSRVIPFNLTLTEVGVNEKVVFELWYYNVSSAAFEYSGLWNQLFVNVTPPPTL